MTKLPVLQKSSRLFNYRFVITDKGVMGINDQTVAGAFQSCVRQFDGAIMFFSGPVEQIDPRNRIDQMEMLNPGDDADFGRRDTQALQNG